MNQWILEVFSKNNVSQVARRRKKAQHVPQALAFGIYNGIADEENGVQQGQEPDIGPR